LKTIDMWCQLGIERRAILSLARERPIRSDQKHRVRCATGGGGMEFSFNDDAMIPIPTMRERHF
jgi:hypothetical protein